MINNLPNKAVVNILRLTRILWRY